MNRITRQVALSICLTAGTGIALAAPVSGSTIQTRIVGGSDMDIAFAPATVALISNSALAQTGSFFQSQFCGGTVIAARWVLTAAHCLVHDNVTTPAGDISILMGSTDLEATVNQAVGVIRVIPHQHYNAVATTNDIALLELDYDALVTPAILDMQPVVLDEDALIAGWGALNMGSATEKQYFPSILQAAFVKMIPSDQCATQFPRYARRVDSRNLCAGVPSGGIDSCQGDSGGPLYRYEPGNSAFNRLTGVVSWGYGCALADAPGVYTRVAAFADWITDNSGIATTDQPLPPVVTIEQPVNDEITDTVSPVGTGEALPNTNNNATIDYPAQLAAAGANGYLLLMALTGMLMLRRSRKALVIAGALTSVLTSACSVSMAQPETADEADTLASSATDHAMEGSVLAMTRQAIGKKRDAVIIMAGDIWRSESACNIIRTGAGNSRRAYFLETCAFSNPQCIKVCNATPEWIEYRFLENTLIQVAIDIDSLANQQQYEACVTQPSALVHENTSTQILTDQSSRTTVSDASAIDKIHWLGKSTRSTLQ